jgi:dipeptidyl aminopeptidase/acylaminoacyl peptidase
MQHPDSAGLYLLPMQGALPSGAPHRFPNVPLTGEIDGLRFSPEGDRVVFRQGGALYLADLATETIARVTAHTFAAHPDWHPSGERLLYAHTSRPAGAPQDSSGIRELVLETGEDRPFRRSADGEPVSGSYPRWRPSGDRIVFTQFDPRTGGTEIFETSKRDVSNRRLTSTGWRCVELRWFGDDEIVFARTLERGDATYVFTLGSHVPRWFPSLHEPIPLGRDFAFDARFEHAVVPRADDAGVVVLWVVDLRPSGGVWQPLTGAEP